MPEWTAQKSTKDRLRELIGQAVAATSSPVMFETITGISIKDLQEHAMHITPKLCNIDMEFSSDMENVDVDVSASSLVTLYVAGFMFGTLCEKNKSKNDHD